MKTEKRIEQKVYEYIQEKRLLKNGAHVIVGVSGGPDSVCLLYLLHRFAPALSLRLTAVHVHHGIRGEGALRDARMTEELCARLQVPCQVFYEDVPARAAARKLSLEEAGREARYEKFRQVQKEKQADVIAVAHHAGDNAETFLWNLVRGSGLLGLSGMDAAKDGVIRPLLCCTKEEITAYLEAEGIPFCEDETNQTLAYTRNQIRHKILPAMEALNPQAAAHILSAAQLIGEAEQWMEDEARRFLECHGSQTPADGELSLPVQALKEARSILRFQVYREAMSCLGCPAKDVGRRHLQLADSLLDSPHGAAVQLPGGTRFLRRYDTLTVQKNWKKTKARPGVVAQQAQVPADYPVPAGYLPEGTLSLRLLPSGSRENFPQKMYTKWFDYDKIKNGLSLRTRLPGDYIRISPDGRKKTVKALMIDEKVPQSLRDRLLLVADGSHVLWIVGMRVSQGCEISENTKTIIQIQMRKESEDE